MDLQTGLPKEKVYSCLLLMPKQLFQSTQFHQFEELKLELPQDKFQSTNEHHRNFAILLDLPSRLYLQILRHNSNISGT